MDRRHFLMAGGALLSQPMVPSFAALPKVTKGKLYFGYSDSDVGSRIGQSAADLLYKFDEELSYDIVNVSERNTIAAANVVKNADISDDVMLQVNGTIMSLNSCLYNNLPYDSLTDFSPIIFLGEYTYIFVVGPLVDRWVKTVDDYIKWVYQNPEYRDFGSVLHGSETHLAGLTLAQEKKIALRSQSYGGAGSLTEDLLDGALAAGFIPISNAASGFLRVLGICCSERHPAFPKVPTFKEQGIDNLDFRGWYGWVIPKNTSLEKRAKLSIAITKMRNSAEFKVLQESFLLTPLNLSPAAIHQRIRNEVAQCEQQYEKFQLSKIDYVI